MTPALNKPLPEFEALATGGVKFTPQAFAGKIVVLYFYPKDNTPGCTTEAMQFRDHHKDFVKAGAVVFGVSRDNMASHDKFKQSLELPFELIADTEEKLCHMFGVVKNKIMYGKKVKGIERSTFLIDAQRRAAGRVARHQGRRPRRRSAEGRQGAEEGRLNRKPARRRAMLAAARRHRLCIMVHARRHCASAQAAQPTVRLFCFLPPTPTMPLPKPPAKRASLLSAADFDPGRTPTRQTLAEDPRARTRPLLELVERRHAAGRRRRSIVQASRRLRPAVRRRRRAAARDARAQARAAAARQRCSCSTPTC